MRIASLTLVALFAAASVIPAVAEKGLSRVRPEATCNSGPSITCRKTCSGGAAWITWECCIDPSGYLPACYIDCDREVIECLPQ